MSKRTILAVAVATGLAVAVATGLAGAARAEVTDRGAGGFTVIEKAAIAAPAAKVWDALAHLGAWWNPAHSYSGDAGAFSVALKPGGFWAEALPGGGGVRHMVIVYVQPGQTLRMEGALGPLQALGVAGHLTWAMKETNGVTALSVTYDVGGHAPGGLDKLAGPVDGVLADQVKRLKAYVETGKPG